MMISRTLSTTTTLWIHRIIFFQIATSLLSLNGGPTGIVVLVVGFSQQQQPRHYRSWTGPKPLLTSTTTTCTTSTSLSNDYRRRRKLAMSSNSNSIEATTFVEAISKAISDAVGRIVVVQSSRGGGYSGGGGASTSVYADVSTGTKYFIKSAVNQHDMLQAEYLGVLEMSNTNTIKVPTPIAFGSYKNQAFVVFEYLEMSSGGSQYELGKQLAKMHKYTSPNQQYGFHIDNTIGATFQPNLPWYDTWSEFWLQHRLNHMLRLTYNAGLDNTKIEKLIMKTQQLLSHNPPASLVHGDLWGGNKGFCKQTGSENVIPCIFDPATYYGDREVDVAMTYLFGGFSSDFYKGYNDEYPLPEGHQQRRTVYNLYHILNHDVLFGGGYIHQARGMIEEILRY